MTDQCAASATVRCGSQYTHRVLGCRGPGCLDADRAEHQARRAKERSEITRRPNTAEWTAAAACAGEATSMFFPEPAGHGTWRDAPGATDPYQPARAICGGCPARAACLEWGLSFGINAQDGMLGGLDPTQRRRILRERHRRRRAGLPPLPLGLADTG